MQSMAVNTVILILEKQGVLQVIVIVTVQTTFGTDSITILCVYSVGQRQDRVLLQLFSIHK